MDNHEARRNRGVLLWHEAGNDVDALHDWFVSYQCILIETYHGLPWIDGPATSS